MYLDTDTHTHTHTRYPEQIPVKSIAPAKPKNSVEWIYRWGGFAWRMRLPGLDSWRRNRMRRSLRADRWWSSDDVLEAPDVAQAGQDDDDDDDDDSGRTVATVAPSCEWRPDWTAESDVVEWTLYSLPFAVGRRADSDADELLAGMILPAAAAAAAAGDDDVEIPQ